MKAHSDRDRDVKASRHGEHCKGPGDNHLMGTGQGRTEAWSSCPSPCSSAGRGDRAGRREAAGWPSAPLLPVGLVPQHPAADRLCPGTPSQFWAGPGQARPGRRGSQGRFRPGRQGPQRPVAPASSRSCCIQGWPDLCWGHGPRAGRGARPPRRAAHTCEQDRAGTENLSRHRATASVTSAETARCWGPRVRDSPGGAVERGPKGGWGRGHGRALGGPWQGLASRGFVVLHGLPGELSPGVDCEDSRFWEPHLPVGSDILWETGRPVGCTAGSGGASALREQTLTLGLFPKAA